MPAKQSMKAVIFGKPGGSSLSGLENRSDNETYLSGHIDNLNCIILPLVLDHFAECIFDSRVIAVDEQTIHELDGQ